MLMRLLGLFRKRSILPRLSGIFIFLIIISTPYIYEEGDIIPDTREFDIDLFRSPAQRLINSDSDFDGVEKIDYYVERFIRLKEIKGLSIAIAKNDSLIFAKGYGIADDIENKKVSPKNIFRVASWSKLITAISIMTLVEDDKLTLEDKVFGKDGIINDTIYMPYKDKRLNNITVRQLLCHAGGWTTRYGDPMFNLNSIAKKVGDPLPATRETLLKFTTSRNLHFTPGTRSAYSNLGFFLLGEVIERVSGKDFESYAKDRYLTTAGILDSYLAYNHYYQRYDNEVKYFEPIGAKKVPSYADDDIMVNKVSGGNNYRLLEGAGGWVISPIDMIRVAYLVDGNDATPDILSKSSVETMLNVEDQYMGSYGWRSASKNGTKYRTGSMSGTQAVLKQMPNGYTYSIVTNTSSWRASRFSSELTALVEKIIRTPKQWPKRDLFKPINKHKKIEDYEWENGF